MSSPTYRLRDVGETVEQYDEHFWRNDDSNPANQEKYFPRLEAVRLPWLWWVSCCGGAVVGSMLPFGLRRLRSDPAASSAPFAATLVDVIGLVISFSVGLVVFSRHVTLTSPT